MLVLAAGCHDEALRLAPRRRDFKSQRLSFGKRDFRGRRGRAIARPVAFVGIRGILGPLLGKRRVIVVGLGSTDRHFEFLPAAARTGVVEAVRRHFSTGVLHDARVRIAVVGVEGARRQNVDSATKAVALFFHAITKATIREPPVQHEAAAMAAIGGRVRRPRLLRCSLRGWGFPRHRVE